MAAQELAFEKTLGVGSKIDIVLTLVRIGFFFGDHLIISKNLTRAEEYVPFSQPRQFLLFTNQSFILYLPQPDS